MMKDDPIRVDKINDGMYEEVKYYPDGTQTFVKRKLNKPKLLTIELDSFNDAPVVYYKGQRVNNIMDINFIWNTDTNEPGEKKLGISYIDTEEKVIKGIKEIKI